jgi:hypothetical protein
MKGKRNLLIILLIVILVAVVTVGAVLAFRPKEKNNPSELTTLSTTLTTATVKPTSSPSTNPATTSVTSLSTSTATTVKPSPSPTTAPATTLVTPPPSVTPTTTQPTTTPPPPPTIDFSKWIIESYNPMSDEYYSQPSWDISATKDNVVQNANCQPSLFYSNFPVMNNKVHVKIKPLTTPELDDDYIGFALGIQPGDAKNNQAGYLLIDWKNSIPGEDLYKDFSGGGPGGLAKVGLALSQVKGIPTPDEFWQHADDTQGSPQGEGLTELARAKILGNTGWSFDHEYDFSFEFTKSSLKVYVDGVLEISVTGNFSDGRLAFYNFSQAGVVYSAS